MASVDETVDPFQMALAELAGLDPTKVLAGSVGVDFNRGPRGTVARVTASVSVAVDPDEVVRLAMEHGRLEAAQ